MIPWGNHLWTWNTRIPSASWWDSSLLAADGPERGSAILTRNSGLYQGAQYVGPTHIYGQTARLDSKGRWQVRYSPAHEVTLGPRIVRPAAAGQATVLDITTGDESGPLPIGEACAIARQGEPT